MACHTPIGTARSARARLAALCVALLLSGCAAQQAYRDGLAFAEQNKIEAALQKYQEAIAHDPTNARYKQALLTTRNAAVGRALEQADRQLAAGARANALLEYERALVIDPLNERARIGMRAVDTAARHESMLAAGEAALARQELAAARAVAQAILTELPRHSAAQRLLQKLDQAAKAPAAASALAAVFRQAVTLEFKDAPLKQVFDTISRRSGLNFVFDKDVRADQKVSISLKNNTIEAALYYLLVSNNLEQQVMDQNTLLIYPNVPAKLKEYQEMVIKTFFLANADAKIVANTLKTILKSRDVVVDEKLNLLILRDNVEAIRLAEKLVALQDVAEPEVVIEVEVLEIKRSRLLELGVDWPTKLTFAPITSLDSGPLTVAALRGLNRTNIGVAGVAANINLNKTDGDANILANPHIRVRNKEKAKVVIGERVPNITTTVSPGANGFASETPTYVDVGLTLNVEPTIYLNNEVGIRVSLEVSNLLDQITTKSGATAYRLGTRQASTMLQLKDGENQVLAGLLSNEERTSSTKIPGIGDIPILGRLFGSANDNSDKTEIVLSITPRLVRNMVRPEASASEFGAGTESSFRRRPDPAAKAPTLMPTAPAALPPAAPIPPAPIPPAPNPAAPNRTPPSLQTPLSPVLNSPAMGAPPVPGGTTPPPLPERSGRAAEPPTASEK